MSRFGSSLFPCSKCFLFGCLAVFFTGLTTVSSATRPMSEVSRLRDAIFKRYNKTITPGYKESPPDVGIILSLHRILQLDENTGTISIEASLRINWRDERLSWEEDPENKDISWLNAMPEDVWKPKVNVFNRGHGERLINAHMPLFVTRRGRVWWAISALLHPSCPVGDMRWFPMDYHVCKIKMGALIPQEYLEFFFGLQQTSVGLIETLDFMQGPVWDLVGTDYYKDFDHQLDDLFYLVEVFTIKIRRQTPLVALWSMSILLSCMALSWASFVLPPSGGALLRRMSLSMVATVLCSVLLLTLLRTVPGSGQRTPIIVVMCLTSTILTFLSTLHTVVVSVLLQRSPKVFGNLRKLPITLQTMLGLQEAQVIEKMDVAVLLSQGEDTVHSVEQFQKEPSPPEPVTWHQVTEALDRVHLLSQVLLSILVFTLAAVV